MKSYSNYTLFHNNIFKTSFLIIAMADKKTDGEFDKKPAMRAVKTVSIEQVVEAENGKLHIKDISIAGKKYSLDIINGGLKEGEESLVLDFNDGEYGIIIDNEGIRFERFLYRPQHDHNDVQSLQIEVDERFIGIKKGQIYWLSRGPYKKEGYDHFRIPFGAATE